MTEVVIDKTQLNKPDDRLTIHVNGTEKELFMSGGLVRALVPYYRNLGEANEVFGDSELQNYILTEVLKERTKRGAPVGTHDWSIDDFEVSQEDSIKIIGWVTEHVLYFFIDSVMLAQNLEKRQKPMMEQLAKLTQSQTGSAASQE